MRGVKIIGCIALLLFFCVLPVCAQTVDDLYREQLEASGVEGLLQQLPHETRILLERLGVTSPEGSAIAHTDVWLRELLALFKAALQEPLAACGTMLGVLVLYAWMVGMRHTLRVDETTDVFGTVCALAACGAILLPIAELIRGIAETVESVSVFMTAFVPVYGGILVSAGRPGAALSFQSVVLYAAELLGHAVGTFVVPLLTVSLAMSLTGSLTPDLKLGRVGVLSGKAASSMLGVGMMLFTGILSFQSLTSGAADRLSDRALRFSVSHFVPIVGGSLGEAFSTVRGCLHALRSTVGGIGVAATALMILPSLCTCVVWNVLLSVGEVVAELFGLDSFTELLKNAHSVVRCLIGVLCVSGLLLTVSLTVVTLTAGGAA